MKALIFAGGLGTRLRQVVSEVPKPMAPVHKRPFLEYLLDFWIDQGVSEFFLSIGHLAEKIESYFQNSYRGKPIHTILEPTPLGTGGALLHALDQSTHLKNEQTIVVVNGDTFFEFDFPKMRSFHEEKRADLTLAIREVTFNSRYSGVQIDENQKIKLFAKRDLHSSHLLINAGVYLLNPRLFEQTDWTTGEKYSLEDEFFPKLIEKCALYGYLAQGRFIDIGIPEDYKRAQLFFNL